MQADPVTERHKSVRDVLGANRRFAGSTARVLAELITPELEDGESLPNIESLQRLCAAALDRRWHRLYAADEACSDAQVHHQALLDEREGDFRPALP